MEYATIVADPPWRYKTTLPGFSYNGSGTATPQRPRSAVPYDTMTLAEIMALPVAGMAAASAHLYLWTTNTHLPHAFAVAAAWGFKYSTLLVWTKTPRGFAGFPTYNICTEFVLFCRRGSLKAKTRIDRNWWECGDGGSTAPSLSTFWIWSRPSVPARIWRCSAVAIASAGMCGATRSTSLSLGVAL